MAGGSRSDQLKKMKLAIVLLAVLPLILAGTLPDACNDSDHNSRVVTECLQFLTEYEAVSDLKAAKTSCQIHDEIETCVKDKGGLCKGQGKELYGVSGIFEKACQNHDDDEVLWKFLTDVVESNEELEHQLERDFSNCLEEAALNFFDFAKILFSDDDDEDDFEIDLSKLLENVYVCGLGALGKTFHVNILSLDRLAKGFLHYSGLESSENIEVCKSKLTLVNDLCAEADKCLKNDDHNDEIALKCFDEFDRHVTDYSVFKGKEKSTELYEKIKRCIHEQGDFCHDQSDLGPALLNVFKHVSEHEHDGDTWWILLNKMEHASEADENKFDGSFVHCLNESNSHFLSPQHLSVRSFDQLNKYLEALYVCVVASVADTFAVDYESVGRLSNAFVKELGFEVDEVNFCGHPLSLPAQLCAGLKR